jgi:hypothetical protein
MIGLLGSDLSTITSSVQVHTTPSNRQQPFTGVTATGGPTV